MENTEGNSEAVVDAVVDDSSDGFFEALENDVNGMITEGSPEATQQEIGPEQVTQDVGSNSVDWENDSNPYKKRYQDSSRESVKNYELYKGVEPFVPVLEAMKNDSGLVEHVREYLVNGGPASKSVQDSLGLDEDFIFDSQEAMTDPKSDSAKVMNAQVDRVVQARVGQILQGEKQRNAKMQQEAQRSNMEQEFKTRKGMNDEQFEAFKTQAQQHTLTLDDIEFLLNKDQANANVVQNTKKDMLNQMKNVRNIPTSASGANSQAQEKDPDSRLFDGILGLDGGLDNLFG